MLTAVNVTMPAFVKWMDWLQIRFCTELSEKNQGQMWCCCKNQTQNQKIRYVAIANCSAEAHSVRLPRMRRGWGCLPLADSPCPLLKSGEFYLPLHSLPLGHVSFSFFIFSPTSTFNTIRPGRVGGRPPPLPLACVCLSAWWRSSETLLLAVRGKFEIVFFFF